MVSSKSPVVLAGTNEAGISNGAMLKECPKPVQIATHILEQQRDSIQERAFVLRQLCERDISRRLMRLEDNFDDATARHLASIMLSPKIYASHLGRTHL